MGGEVGKIRGKKSLYFKVSHSEHQRIISPKKQTYMIIPVTDKESQG